MSGVSAMSDRIRVIIKDSGRMLNEMSDGNFAIDTECEEVYTGAFTDLLTGIRKMNEEIATKEVYDCLLTILTEDEDGE